MVGWRVSRGASALSDDEIAAIEALGAAKARLALQSSSRARKAYRVQTVEAEMCGLPLATPEGLSQLIARTAG